MRNLCTAPLPSEVFLDVGNRQAFSFSPENSGAWWMGQHHGRLQQSYCTSTGLLCCWGNWLLYQVGESVKCISLHASHGNSTTEAHPYFSPNRGCSDRFLFYCPLASKQLVYLLAQGSARESAARKCSGAAAVSGRKAGGSTVPV